MSITPQEAEEEAALEQFVKEIEVGKRPKLDTIDDIKNLLWKSFPRMVYHYTTPEGLNGILKSQSFWLTDSDFLNDKSEFLYSVEMLSLVINKLLAKDPNNDFFKNIIKRIKEIEEGFSIFGESFVITSFSAEYDFLSQFMQYANNCSGYCLGIDTNLLIENCHIFNIDNIEKFKGSRNGFDFGTEIKPNFEYFHIGKVIYNSTNQEKIINILLKEGEKKYTFGLGDISVNIEMFLDDIKPYLLLMKDSIFESENEYRIICWMEDSLKLNNRVVNNIPIPYLELAPNDDELLPIKSITVGSKIDYSLAKLSFTKFDIFHKLPDIQIFQSKLPIR